MNIQVEDAGTCLKSIKVEIPADLVNNQLNRAYRDLAKQVQLPGFRKGKAPLNILEKKYSDHVLKDVREQMIREALDEARRDHDLDFVDTPEIDEVNEVKRGTAFSFALSVEVKPEFDVPEYKDMQFDSKEPAVSDKEVEIFVRNVQLTQGALNDLGAKEASEVGDVISGDFSIYIGEERVAGRPGGNLEVGGDTILGVEVPAAAKDTVGIKGSELPLEKRYSVKLPEDFPLAKYVGKEADIVVNIKDIKRPDCPELNDELAKEMGYESLSEMRVKAREIIETEKKNQALQDLENRIVDAITEKTELSIPPRFAEKQLSNILQREAFRMYQDGTDDESIKTFIEKRREELPSTIEDELKQQFIIEAIGKKERVFVTEEEIVRHIQQIAYMRGQDPNQLIEYFVQQEMIPQIRWDMRAQKIKATLRKRVKVNQLDAKGQPLPEKPKKAKKEAASADAPASKE